MSSKTFTVYRAVPIAEGGDRRPYFGSTCNFKKRVKNHRHFFNIKPKLLVYSAMHANGGIDNYRFEIIAEFDSASYPEGIAARLAVEMEGALVREFGAVNGCLNLRIPGRSDNEGHRDRYQNDPKFRHKCIQQAKEYRLTLDPEQYRAAGRVRAAKSYARKKAARLANINKSVV